MALVRDIFAIFAKFRHVFFFLFVFHYFRSLGKESLVRDACDSGFVHRITLVEDG
jgi:hypothetical protein